MLTTMAGYYDDIGDIRRVVPLGPDDYPRVPESTFEGVPYRIGNLPPDEVVFAAYGSVAIDAETRNVTVDTKDCVPPLPANEWTLRQNPALMKVVAELGGKAVEGYLVDYRHAAFFYTRDSRLQDGIASYQFEEFRNRFRVEMALGVIVNNAGVVEYTGPPELEPTAQAMMRRVDAFARHVLATTPRYQYIVPTEQIDRSGRLPAGPEARPQPPASPFLRSPVAPDDSAE